MDPLNLLFLNACAMSAIGATTVAGIKIYQLYTKGSPSKCCLLEGKPIENLQRLANATIAQMPALVTMERDKDFRSWGPYVYRGQFGYKNEREFQATANACVKAVAILTGLTGVTLYSLTLVKECARSVDKLLYCTEEFAAFLKQGKLAVLLLIGGLAAGNLIKAFFFDHIFLFLSDANEFNKSRFEFINKEFIAMTRTLSRWSNKTTNTVEEKLFIRALAKDILRNMPLIREQLNRIQNFNAQRIETIALPLETACRRII